MHFLRKVARRAAVLIGELTLGISPFFIQLAMFDLKIEEAVGGTPTPLLNFDLRAPAVYKFLSLPSLPLSFKSKEAAIIFAQEILSTR